MPRAFISVASSASTWTQCSTESTPATTAFQAPSAPIACAATPRPHLCASSTAATNSSGVNAVNVASIPGVRTPPVAITLMTRAPPLISSRTA